MRVAGVGAEVGLKGGWLAVVHHFPSEMAQNFWTAIWAFGVCFAVTIGVSLVTRQRKTDDDLAGLVYALTPKPREEDIPWYKRPAILGGAVLALTLVLNLIFW